MRQALLVPFIARERPAPLRRYFEQHRAVEAVDRWWLGAGDLQPILKVSPVLLHSLSYVVATNVFQHFSARQHTQYVEDAHALLQDGGLFIFNLTIDTGKLPAYMRDQDGSAWAVHYGQYTPIPTASSVYAELARTFDILYVTQRYDGLFNFICQKRPHARIATPTKDSVEFYSSCAGSAS